VQFTAVDGSAAGIVVATHDPALVVLSVVISILGAYAATELVGRVRSAHGRAALLWLAGGALVDGIGTWSMHYTAKLALRVPGGLYLDWRLVLLSLAVGATGSAGALAFMRQQGRLSWKRAVAAGILLGGVGIAGLHYTAMAAVIGPRIHHYHSPLLVVLSIAVGIGTATMATLLVRWFDAAPRNRRFGMPATTLVRGMANPAMHYTAMAGIVFANGAPPLGTDQAVSIVAVGVIGISIVPMTVLVVALLTCFIDRLHKERAVLSKLFDETPEAVAVTRNDGEIVRVNREFTRLFGYAPQEAIGRRLGELIATGAGAEDAAAREGRTPIEGSRRHKDGTQIRVAGVRVQVAMPTGETEQYSLMRDVTEQQRAEQALRLFPRRLIEAEEAEKQRIARELHDEVGQMLTGVGMLLGSTEGMPAEVQTRIAEARTVLHALTARVRGMTLDLRPAQLEDFGLVRALRTLFQRYERQTGIRVAFEGGGLEGRRFPPEIEITAYRIVQEALTNVARHAQVQEAAVRLSCEDESLRVEIADRGPGFDFATRSTDTVGVAGMFERAAAVGGELMLTPSAGSGTRVVARLPLESPAATAAEQRESDQP
jgi:PAS domain S-box-containing protein